MRALLLFFLLLVVGFAKNVEVYTVAMPKTMAPYSFLNENNEPSGILVEYWQLWAKRNGYSIKFVPLTWNESVKALQAKRVHLHTGLFKNQEREQYATFLKPLIGSYSYVYALNKNKEHFASMQALDGKRIGLTKGTYFESYFKKHYPKIEQKYYKTTKALVDALSREEIDALVTDGLIAWLHTIQRYNFANAFKVNDFSLYRWFHAAVAKGDSDLQKRVSRGMEKITVRDMVALEQKWIANEEFRYFQKQQQQSLLNQEEFFWLSGHSNIRLAVVKYWPRFSQINEQGDVQGFHIDLLKMLNKNLNLSLEYQVFDTWAQAFEASKKGEVEAILGLSYSKEREKYFHFGKPYYYTPNYLVVHERSQDIKALKDLAGKKVLVYQNSITKTLLQNKSPQAKIEEKSSLDAILTTLSKQEAAAAVFENAKSANLAAYGLKIKKALYTKEGALHIGVSRRYASLHSILQKALASLSGAQIRYLEQKWLKQENFSNLFTKEELEYIQNTKVLKVGVDSWAPIYFIDKQGRVGGVAGDLLKHITKISGLEFHALKQSWQENLRDFKMGKIDIMPGMFYTKERTHFARFTDSYYDIPTVIFTKVSNKNIYSFKDLLHKKLAITAGDARIKDIKRIYPDIIIVPVKSIKEALYKLIANEVDAIADLDLVVQDLLRKELIGGIKMLPQNTIPARTLHMATQKHNTLLHAILQKSLYTISTVQKERLLAKWTEQPFKKDVKVGFGVGRDPYSLNQNLLKGIEYELMQAALGRSGVRLQQSVHMLPNALQRSLKEDKSLDIVATVKERDDGFFYSDTFISFENVVVSRAEDNLYINSVADLKDKRLIAFKDAYKYLGTEYFELFKPEQRLPSYKEVEMQARQVKDFLDKKADVLVLDKNIFLWHLKRLSNLGIEAFKFDFIFQGKNHYKVAFRDKSLRDLFNKNLRFLKSSGKYKEIFKRYTHTEVEAKVEISSFIASVLADFLYSHDKQSLAALSNRFVSLPYIKKIEVFDNSQNQLFSSTLTKYEGFEEQESFYFISNVPQKVGSVRIYFDDDELPQGSNTQEFIPALSSFTNFKGFGHIQSVYERFEYLDKEINFNKRENEYLKTKPILRYSEINWQPLSIIENNTMSGVLADYMQLIEEKTGIRFVYVPANSWIEVITKFKRKEIDFIPSISGTAKEHDLGFVSKIYSSFNFAIVMDKEGSYTPNLNALVGKTLAIPRGYTSYNLVKKSYPSIKIIATKDVNEALKLVAQKKADAFVGHVAVATHHIKEFFPDLKIVGLASERFNHHFLVQDDLTDAQTVLNKVIDSFTQQQKHEISKRWIDSPVKTAVDYTLVYVVSGVFSVVLIIVLIFTKKLMRAKAQIEASNQKLRKTLVTLNKAQDQLISAEKMASLGGLVAGVAHEINTPIGIGLTGSTHFLDSSRDLRKKYESDEMSQEEFEEFLNTTTELAKLINTNLEKAASLVKSFKQIAVDQTSEERREFGLYSYTKEILESMHSVLKKRPINVVINCDSKLKLFSYPGAYSQMISNLIMNSLVHGFEEYEQGKISLTIRAQIDEVVIIYKDNGKGIKKENLSKIFDPFFTTKRHQGGSGLGLNIIYNIVTNTLGGKIMCQSQEGEGVEFIITLRR